jgi:hypothetical protein
VSEGYDTAEKIKNAFGFVNRQSSYYRHAAEILGLVSRWRYKVTDIGEKYLCLSSKQKSQYLCKLLLEFPVINQVFLDISIDPGRIVDRKHIVELLRKYSHLTGSTLERRAQTIISWFRWISNNVGIIQVNDNGQIRIAVITKHYYMKSCILGYYPLANPKTKPAETLDTSGIPTVDNVAEWVPSMVFETCVIASTTQLIPTASVMIK